MSLRRCSAARLLLLQVLFFYMIVIRDAVPTAIGNGGGAAADSYRSLSQNQGLYNSSDSVIVLNSTNFESTIYGSRHGWLVEFYNSWCGFCQRFAPTWKSLARNIRAWGDVVAVGALDCADDDNNPLCRKYEIMNYPEVRYFAPNEKPGKLGDSVEKGKNMDALRENLIRKLRSEQQEGRGGAEWPNLGPYRSSEIEIVWKDVPKEVKYYFFLFEEADSYLGSEIILDLGDAKSLIVRSVSRDNQVLCQTRGITRFPSLVAYGRDGAKDYIKIGVQTREGMRGKIVEFMRSKGIDIKMAEIRDEHPDEWLLEARPSPSRNIATKKSAGNEASYRLDLEIALRFSFRHEIPMTRIIDGEKMRALKNFTSVLAAYFPVARGDREFLQAISRSVGSRSAMSGEEFGNLVESTGKKFSPVYPKRGNDWAGCRPSKSGLRGYPCGLWCLFHALTVNFATSSGRNDEPTKILRSMHGYVKNFFGCADCSRHFVTMADKNNIFNVSSANESVLWLWRAHNEVNERLAGDASTEDPEHKKIQYPSRENCPSCRDYKSSSAATIKNWEWNETEVLAYLKNKYSYSSSDASSSSSSFITKLPSFDKITINESQNESFMTKNMAAKKLGWDFTIFDISICVVLYVTSAIILVLVCIKFAVKRSRKKKMYIRSVLGKV